MTTIHTEAFRRIEADETGFSVTCTSSDSTLEVALNADERRALAAALDPERDFSGVDWKTMFEHEIRNRVAAVALLRRERDEALRVKGEMVDRAVRAERERDAAVAHVKELEPKVGWVHNHSFEDGPCNEIRLADGRIIGSCQLPERMRTAVTRADVEKAIRSRHILRNWVLGADSVTVEDAVDAVYALVSGSDPAVYVVRESAIDAVEAQPIDGGKWWLADGALVNMCESPTESEAQEAVDDALATLVGALAARRAIEAEQAADPVAEQTDALADILYGHEMVTDQMRGVLERVVRAGMLLPGQEEGDE